MRATRQTREATFSTIVAKKTINQNQTVKRTHANDALPVSPRHTCSYALPGALIMISRQYFVLPTTTSVKKSSVILCAEPHRTVVVVDARC